MATRVTDVARKSEGEVTFSNPTLAAGQYWLEVVGLAAQIVSGLERLGQWREESLVLTEMKAMRRELAATRQEWRETYPLRSVNEDELKRFLFVARKLRQESRNGKAPVGVVFDCLVLDGLSQRQTARACGCSPSLVVKRVVRLEGRFRSKIAHLRALAWRATDMETTVKGDRLRRRRQGAGGLEWDSTGGGDEGSEWDEEAGEG